MRSRELIELQREQPFNGLRIYVSDGAVYEVRHPEMMLVTRDRVHIALPPPRGDVPVRAVYCDPLHITRVEPMNGGKRAGRRTK